MIWVLASKFRFLSILKVSSIVFFHCGIASAYFGDRGIGMLDAATMNAYRGLGFIMPCDVWVTLAYGPAYICSSDFDYVVDWEDGFLATADWRYNFTWN